MSLKNVLSIFVISVFAFSLSNAQVKDPVNTVKK